MKILVLESSTTSAKAMLYDSKDNQYEFITRPYKWDYSRCDRTWQAEETYLQMLETGRELLQKTDAGRKDGGHCRDEVEMIALVGVWHSLFLANKKVEPVTAVYHWNHSGAAQVCAQIRKCEAATMKYYHTSGCMVNAIYPFFKIEMLRREGAPALDSYLMSQGSYNTWRMTGQKVATRCNASGDGLLDVKAREYNWDGLKEFGVEKWQLFPLVDSENVWPLQEEAANYLGVRSGIPVMPANADGGSNQIGAGAALPGIMTFSVGTSGAMRLSTTDAVLPDKPGTWCYLSPKGYLSGAATNGCCICTDWAKNRFFPKDTSYQEIEDGIRDYETPPVFLPFLTGERCPGWNDERESGFHHVKLKHTANDLYYAVQQGILFNLYQCYQTLIKVNPKPSQIMLSGGILKSKAWTQMCADIFDSEMSITNVDQGSLLGGVVMAMEALHLLERVEDYHPEIVQMIRPDTERHQKYMQQYQRYLDCYEQKE